MQMAPQPQQLLLEYAQAAALLSGWCRSLMWPTIPTARSCGLLPCGESCMAAAKSAMSEAKLAAATAALAATEAEIDEREAML